MQHARTRIHMHPCMLHDAYADPLHTRNGQTWLTIKNLMGSPSAFISCSKVPNTNLSALASETMWSQPILIELLAVLLLLQTHMHFASCTSRHFSLRTCLKSS
jgi:hypothetical protein